jgi:hypothetical protein
MPNPWYFSTIPSHGRKSIPNAFAQSIWFHLLFRNGGKSAVRPFRRGLYFFGKASSGTRRESAIAVKPENSSTTSFVSTIC